MATYTRFAIFAAGGVGSAAADELLKKNLTVTILTRDDSKAELLALKQRGAVLAKVDYADQAAVQQALAGVEVVYVIVDGGALPSLSTSLSLSLTRSLALTPIVLL
jgi:uncharacterized protein YbjT (DUF2867 family)